MPLNELPARDDGALRVWLRIALATVVVIGLAVVTGVLDDKDGDSDFVPIDGRASDGAVKRCGADEAERVARLWFRAMSSGQAEPVKLVTSRGEPRPRYVITTGRGGEARTVRIPGRAAAAGTVPDLIGETDGRRSLRIDEIGTPPRAFGIGSSVSGRLAGVAFTAVVGGSRWSGKMGVRCGNDSAYFAAFTISGR